jgi:hypothetical protein
LSIQHVPLHTWVGAVGRGDINQLQAILVSAITTNTNHPSNYILFRSSRYHSVSLTLKDMESCPSPCSPKHWPANPSNPPQMHHSLALPWHRDVRKCEVWSGLREDKIRHVEEMNQKGYHSWNESSVHYDAP